MKHIIEEYKRMIEQQNQTIQTLQERLKRYKKKKKRIKWLNKCKYCMVEEQSRKDSKYMRLKDSVLLGIIKYKVIRDCMPTRKEIKDRFGVTDNKLDKILRHIKRTHDIDFMARIVTEDTLIKDIKALKI